MSTKSSRPSRTIVWAAALAILSSLFVAAQVSAEAGARGNSSGGCPAHIRC